MAKTGSCHNIPLKNLSQGLCGLLTMLQRITLPFACS
jgi:hypothetical protein